MQSALGRASTHLAMTREAHGFSRVSVGFSSYDGARQDAEPAGRAYEAGRSPGGGGGDAGCGPPWKCAPLHFTHSTSQGAQKTFLFVQAAPKSEVGQALIESPETSSPSNQYS